MKKLIIILTAVLISNFSIGQSQTKDTCKTFVKFINKSKVTIEVKIYDKMPGNTFPPVNAIRAYTIAPGKEKKMKAEDGETYFYGAQEQVKGSLPFGTTTLSWQGSVDAEDCKTIEEIIE